MNILVIGNGFDLAHGLPTSYKNFLEFCERAKRIYTFSEKATVKEYEDKNLCQWKMDDYIKEQLALAFRSRKCQKIMLDKGMYNIKVTTPNKLLDELYCYINHNTWLEYFCNCSSYIGENWIDFESEISRVIKSLDIAQKWIVDGNSIKELKGNENKIVDAICKASKTNSQEIFEDEREINKFIVFLDEELEKLIRALEIYIAGFVEKINPEKVYANLEDLKLDHVLSFNYSHTFAKIYENDEVIRYDYIHGEAKVSNLIKSNNMVLGIEEYLEDDKKNKEVEFISFKKFYQRIYKGTGCKYKSWLKEIDEENKEYNKKLEKAAIELEASVSAIDRLQKEDSLQNLKKNPPEHNLYILGHSLDVTDKDILRELILSERVYTTIFYYERKNEDEEGDNGRKDLGQKIANLVQVIEQDELIKRTGSSTKTIEFQLL